ncbi:hypothetical protein [Methylobacterium trifolii]|uniref:Uncharacterized protein n=1 Tax=Methylobacterium trifolii TaxID=1003092 RepID=A0ABQ4U3A0_9HYPH|nr:hypothetical protein [Methylobacterium trifolii]GJE60832.1 hypothetical protein MPOCJGCO_2950 [Methylobacterium trifolii]
MVSSPEPASTDTSGRNAGLGIVALVGFTVLLGALLPGRPTHEPAALSPASDAACLEWSDGCHVCRRLPEGPACSLPGIACTPAAPTCLRRVEG